MNTRKICGTGALIVFLLLASVAFAAIAQPAQAPPQGQAGQAAARPAVPRPASPEIAPDKRVTFRLYAPKAAEVLLNGTWDDGSNVKMTKDAGGIWSVTIGPMAPQLWELYWIGAGTTDTARQGAQNLSAMVKKLGFNNFYKEIPGRHYWFLWRDFLGDFGARLFR